MTNTVREWIPVFYCIVTEIQTVMILIFLIDKKIYRGLLTSISKSRDFDNLLVRITQGNCMSWIIAARCTKLSINKNASLKQGILIVKN